MLEYMLVIAVFWQFGKIIDNHASVKQDISLLSLEENSTFLFSSAPS